MKRLNRTHFLFGFLGIALSTVFFMVGSPLSIQNDTEAPAAPAAARTTTEVASFLLIEPVSDSVNLREQPSLESPIVGRVSRGEVFEVAEVCDDALAKIGVGEQWVKGRTADGVVGYTAAWLYAVAGFNSYTTVTPANAAPTTTVATYQGETAIAAACAPQYDLPAVVVDGGSGATGPTTLAATGDDAAGSDTSLAAGAADDTVDEARTDAVGSASDDFIPPLGEPAADLDIPDIEFATSASSADGLFIESANESGINIRARPVDGAVMGAAYPDEPVEVIEAPAEALDKIGVQDQWIKVRTADGIEGYAAAWLFAVTRAPAATADAAAAAVADDTVAAAAVADAADSADPAPLAVDAPVESAFDRADALYLTPRSAEGVNIRATPVTGQVVGMVPAGAQVMVLEPVDVALAKLGVRGEWFQVMTEDGQEGYTAAWLYEATDGPPASDVIPPLTVARDEEPGFLPVQEDDAVYDPNSIAELGLVPSASPPSVGEIAPMGSSILALGVTEAEAEPPLLEPIADDESADEVTLPPLDTGAPAAAASADAASDDAALGAAPAADEPAISAPVADAIPGSDTDDVLPPSLTVEDANPVPDAAPSVELVNEIVPISISVVDDMTIQTAELAINDRPVARFFGAPYEFDLNTENLSVGDYRVTFTVLNADGMLYADETYFEIVLDETPTSPFTLDSSAAPIPSAAAPSRAPRILLIDGEPRPFTLEFSLEDGLVPTRIASDDAEAPTSLGAIWGRPFSSVIPAPILSALTAPRPGLASAIIIAMLFLLLPQGLFTLYWMTYTWNNPKAADEYRSPREFYEPQYSFTAILPARHEEDVIKDTIRAVDRINYPDHLKEILVMIRDEDDDGTINAAQEVIDELGKDNIRLITFTEGPRNKPNGLNRGLKAATKDVVCIFDAEDEPHHEIYNVVNTVMVRDGSDVVQSGVQLMNFKSTWFSSFNVLEYFLWFKSGLHAFTREFGVTPLGGNTVFFKRFWLERIDGWDEGCLTEDGDIGIRLTSLGAKLRIVYDAEHATQEETPDTAESFIKQRTRWCQGFYQIFLKGDWRQLPTLKQKIVALYILLNSLLQAFMLIYVPIGIFMALTQDVAVPLAMLSYAPIYILLVQLIINLISIREFAAAYGEKLPMFFTLKMIVYFYPYQLMQSVSAMRAVYRMVKGQSSWEKTAHSNLHRQANTSHVGA